MLYKEISLSSVFEPTGEPVVEILEKRAEEEKRKDLIIDNPDPRFVYLHVIALGAGEYYGSNSNGDYFPETELIGACKIFAGRERCYGFKTFETVGKVYRLHQNKDSEKSIGDVVKAIYNQKMHRVELIIAVEKEKAPDIVERIDNGEKLPVSMGCKVKYDECSICGNRAYKSRLEYCIHGKMMLNQVLPDGRKVFRINIAPIFHDISFVRVPADKTAYVLAKVAEEKSAEVEKVEPSMAPAEKIDAEELVKKFAKLMNVPEEEVNVELVLALVDEILSDKEMLKEAFDLTSKLSQIKGKLSLLLAALTATAMYLYFKNRFNKQLAGDEVLQNIRRDGNKYFLLLPPWMYYPPQVVAHGEKG